ncbi:hypothetical protein H310_01915 [Aphanomyces invadans]|uniref:PH domain-containing protein n=1 Tax=Aphanomyces invadans TaxID=157072 RepID=A0A024UM86_9STRA|nr:hypothetical protein H310_01915 [Aphanomyces invadans]ETW07389.1 hypothetical protein H310_01915 [Aphanomyces invadans]|eukprot:XP_008863482.1 hypothetical protein H310_01915 [Aphanomyces invadans]
MLAPEHLARSASWHAKDIVRISLESKGVIGFIEVPDMKRRSLESVRPLILQTVDDTPPDFQFVLDSGEPLSRRQEATHLIADHYPCLKIRAVTKRITKSSKFTVYNANGDTFETWVPTEYTFGQLRKDAARYWSIPDLESQLVDNDECLWPEEANILTFLDAHELRLKKMVLTCKQQPRPSSPPPSTSPLPSQPSRHHTFIHTNYEQRLWYIFTYYCVHGDALDLLTMTAYQFHRFLKDCGLFNSRQFTPAMGDIIYAFEGKGKLSKQQGSPPSAHSIAAPPWSNKGIGGYKTSNASKSTTPSRLGSGKLDYDGFLNALLTIASRVQPHATDPDDAFTHLLVKYVLPNAATWAQHAWLDHTDALQQPDVHRFVSKFSPPLFEMFMFYTNQPVTDATKDSGHWMTFSDCMRFMQDFRFTELLLTTQECPELFLAACSSTMRPPFSDNDPTDESLFRRETMSFPAFLDMLGRAGLMALTRHRRGLEPLKCVKAVFHHMTRSLRGSRALEIMHNHGPVAIYASRFYAGSVAFNNKFLDMWRIEGSPDYVTGALPTAAPPLTRGRASLHHIVHYSPPHSPTRRSSATEVAAVRPFDMTLSPPLSKNLNAQHEMGNPTADSHTTAVERAIESNRRGSANGDGGAADDAVVGVLLKGAVFRKYGTWSAPHRRFVWLSDDRKQLHWRPLNKPDQRNDGLTLASVDGLLSGHVDSTRYAFMKYLTEEKYVQRCFSIVAKDGRLDLEADSEATRDAWIDALRTLVPRGTTVQ